MLIVSGSDEEDDYILLTDPNVDCCLDGAIGASGSDSSSGAGGGGGGATQQEEFSLSQTEETNR